MLFSVADVANTIRKVGPEFVILSTDLGQVGFPPPPEGLATYIAELRAQGFTQRELDRMTREMTSAGFFWDFSRCIRG